MPAGPDLTGVIVPYIGLVLVVGLGAAATRWRLLNQERIPILAQLTIGLLLAIFVFWNAATGSVASALGQAPWMVAFGLAVAVGGFSIATAIAPRENWEQSGRSALQVLGATGNTAFLGIPVCAALYGNQGAILALLYDFGASIFLYTIGWAAFQQPTQVSKRVSDLVRRSAPRLANPLVVALLLGLGVALTRWAIPPVLRQPLEALSSTPIPLMLLMIGGIIYNSMMKPALGGQDIFLLTVLKLVLLPILAFLAVNLFPLPAVTRGVVVVESAMPSAVTAALFAERYHADKRLAASAMMVTTLLSTVTVPVFAMLARWSDT